MKLVTIYGFKAPLLPFRNAWRALLWRFGLVTRGAWQEEHRLVKYWRAAWEADHR